jgi:hypothetical protein
MSEPRQYHLEEKERERPRQVFEVQPKIQSFKDLNGRLEKEKTFKN